MSSFKIPYSHLVEVFFGDGDIKRYLQERHGALLTDDFCARIVHEVSKRFKGSFNLRLKSVCYNKTVFRTKYSDWLKNEFEVLMYEDEIDSDNDGTTISRGRPSKPFEQCGQKSQLKKVRQFRKDHSQALIDAASSSRVEQPAASFDTNHALALITQAKLSRDQYEVIRGAVHDLGYKIFPSYRSVLDAKKQCYPDNVNITEISAEVPLQNLLDHTASRIFDSLKSEFENLSEISLELDSKWGCDGASGQSEYQQKFQESVEGTSDAHLFMTSLVPLRLLLHSSDNHESCVWQNPRPSSTNYCRVVKFQHRAETPNLIRQEKKRMEEEINNLVCTKIVRGDAQVLIKHKLHFTMIDGKVVQVVTDTASASNCVVCGAKPSQLNDLSRLGMEPINDSVLSLGISPLHARIRFMEFVLKLAYNQEFKAWRTTAETRQLKDAAKKRIQDEFQKKMGLKVDFVKQGTGTTNDGNTSRRFFQDPPNTAAITGIDEEIISRLATILEVICCQSPIDSEKFKVFSEETAKMIITLYPWYNLPATVHKILFHGSQIIDNAVLPIGILSEEAQEARNKDYKYFRAHHSRKHSRLATTTDIFNNLMISSDPFITNLRPLPKNKHLPLSEEAKALLMY